MYLFVTKLKRLLTDARFDSRNDTNNNSISGDSRILDMEILPIKYSLLTTIAVISTSIILMASFLSGFFFFLAFDALLNTLCLFFMTNYWKLEYKKLCFKKLALQPILINKNFKSL